MSADTTVRSRARSCVAAIVLSLASVPAFAALQPAPASAAMYGQLVLDEAARHYGKPYGWGATGPGSFDCSGFVGYVYRQFGVNLPRTSRDQYDAVAHIPQDQKQPGDLIFTYDSGGIYHVSIYAGNNTAWAATHTGDVVRPQPLWTSSYYVGRPFLGGSIADHWQAMGGDGSVLGQAVNLEHPVPAARKVDFRGGDVYWTPWTGAREVHGGIAEAFDRVGASASSLGVPTTDEVQVPNGRANRFIGGSVYWSPWTGSHAVYGEIVRKHDALGGSASFLGLPTDDEVAVPGGRAAHFVGGAIYWGPATGAFEVHGAILARYEQFGGSLSALGLPVSDERPAPGGRETAFQGGTLRWTAATGDVRLVG